MSVSLIGPQSRVENLDLGPTVRRRLRQLMSLCLKTFTRASLLHGHLDSPSRADHKMPIWPWREQLINSAMFFFHMLPRVLPAPLDPPWSILWRSQAARRILVHRVIASPILAPRWARRPAITVRRILLISPEYSSHVHKDVLVFTRVRRCVDLPLLLLQTSIGKASGFFPIAPQFIKKSAEHMLGGRPFFFFGTISLMGWCDSVHNEFQPCGDPDSLQSKEVLVG